MLFPWKCIGVSSNLTLPVCSPCSICVLLSIIMNESSRARIAGRKMSTAWFWNSENEVENKMGQNINGLDRSMVRKYSQHKLLVIRTQNNLPNGIRRDKYQNAFCVTSFSHFFHSVYFSFATPEFVHWEWRNRGKHFYRKCCCYFHFLSVPVFNDSISDYNGCM